MFFFEIKGTNISKIFFSTPRMTVCQTGIMEIWSFWSTLAVNYEMDISDIENQNFLEKG